MSLQACVPCRFKYKSHRNHTRRVYWHKNPDEVISGSRKDNLRVAGPGNHGVVSALEQKLLEMGNREVFVIYVREEGLEDSPEMWREVESYRD